MKIEKLKTLKALLGSNELILTGSTALAYHGLLTFDEAKDLDLLILNPSPTSTEVLARLHKENQSPKWKEGAPMNYSFIFEGVKVDVWVIKSHEDNDYLNTDYGVKVASIRSIVNAKLSYNRSKDWVQLMRLSRKIYDPAKFEKVLPEIKTESDEYADVE